MEFGQLSAAISGWSWSIHHVSALADFFVLLPASFGLITLLLLSNAAGEALATAKALFLCLATMFALKFAFAICSTGYPMSRPYSPSGHVAFAGAFYGCLALLFSSERRLTIRLGFVSTAIALTGLIAISRVATGTHTIPEALAGAIIGAAAVTIFLALRPRSRLIVLSWTGIAVSILLLIAYFFLVLYVAHRWSVEHWIDAIARQFGAATHICG